jgi:hypothetical protein
MRAGKRAARREVQKHIDFPEDIKQKNTGHQSRTQIAQFYVQPTAVSAGSLLVVRRLFEVNSEPHTGARPSVRLCVGLIKALILCLALVGALELELL